MYNLINGLLMSFCKTISYTVPYSMTDFGMKNFICTKTNATNFIIKRDKTRREKNIWCNKWYDEKNRYKNYSCSIKY